MIGWCRISGRPPMDRIAIFSTDGGVRGRPLDRFTIFSTDFCPSRPEVWRRNPVYLGFLLCHSCDPDEAGQESSDSVQGACREGLIGRESRGLVHGGPRDRALSTIPGPPGTSASCWPVRTRGSATRQKRLQHAGKSLGRLGPLALLAITAPSLSLPVSCLGLLLPLFAMGNKRLCELPGVRMGGVVAPDQDVGHGKRPAVQLAQQTISSGLSLCWIQWVGMSTTDVLSASAMLSVPSSQA